MNIQTGKEIKPFLRWAGGKTWLLKHIEELLPNTINNYYEPFLGGGSVFLYLKAKDKISGKAFLSDSNKDLINCYKVIKSDLNALLDALKKFKNTEESYYKTREKIYNDNIFRAAQFYYLNRTSYNGIFRVNKDGKYNVPYGHRKLDALFEEENLLKLSALFKNCFFSVGDFKKIRDSVDENDFVFLDPPYTVAHENNGFIHYNQKLFSWENQIQLSDLLDNIQSRNAYYLLTNAYHKNVINLYSHKGKIIKLSRSSTIGGIGAKRTAYNELILKNF